MHKVLSERSEETLAQPFCPYEEDASTWPPIRVDILFREHMNMLTEGGLEFANWNPVGITAEDTLLVVDVQNDFIPGNFAQWGGRAAVPEAEVVVEPVVQLIQAFSRRGALVVATRSYHPADHVSFFDQGGPMPSHCVQTTPGSFFYPAVGEALHAAYTKPTLEPTCNGLPAPTGRVQVAFKGFLEDVASPSAFRYDQEHFEQRVGHCRWDLKVGPAEVQSCVGTWTGAMALKCSNLIHDINAGPDLSALLQKNLCPLEDLVPRSGRLLIVGLALDTGVLDSAVAAARLGYENVFVALDACRAAHFGVSGEYGSGFLTDPAYLASQFKKHNIGAVQSEQVLRQDSARRRWKTRGDIEGFGGG